ncbi:MAG: hypothetical protein IPM23_01415 [Candidatus Melainabacteria bacterium]|nr:hypothetical protein [Candidatus Melainabacteria bacterium]
MANTAQELFIQYDKQPLLAALSADFNAVDTAVQSVADCLRKVKELKGARLPHNHPDEALRIEREHAYEVAYIRLELANTDLLAAIKALMKSSADIEANLGEFAGDERSRTFAYREDPIARSNVVCARRLIEEATTLHYRVDIYPEEETTTARYHFAIGRLYKDKPDTGRHFVVAYGGGYGRTSVDRNWAATGPYMTRQEAERSAGGWISFADTIGGSADVIDVRTLVEES